MRNKGECVHRCARLSVWVCVRENERYRGKGVDVKHYKAPCSSNHQRNFSLFFSLIEDISVERARCLSKGFY